MLTIAEHITKAMGEAGGVLMSTMFNTAGQKRAQNKTLAQAMEYGLSRMQFCRGAHTGDRTMIEALSPAFHQFVQCATRHDMTFAAHQGAETTRQMNEVRAGRSSCLKSETLKGVMDPGAHAVERVFAWLAELLTDSK